MPADYSSNYKVSMENRVIVILGCTATGKSALARSLAQHLDAEIVSIDSMKVYRGMDIGTAKPSPDDRAAVPHHLIDVADPWESFSVARFVELADRAVVDIHRRNRPVVAVGGTVLYFKCWYEGLFAGPSADPTIRAQIRQQAATKGPAAVHAELARVDPASAARIHPNDLRRIERALEVYRLTGESISSLQQQWGRAGPRRTDWHWTLIGLRRNREETSRRINLRVKRMIAAGLVQEAHRIWADPRGLGPQARQAVGYAELFEHFKGQLTLEEAVERIKIRSRRIAKHQRTWLVRLPAVQWLDANGIEDAAELVPQALGVIRSRPQLQPQAEP